MGTNDKYTRFDEYTLDSSAVDLWLSQFGICWLNAVDCVTFVT